MVQGKAQAISLSYDERQTGGKGCWVVSVKHGRTGELVDRIPFKALRLADEDEAVGRATDLFAAVGVRVAFEKIDGHDGYRGLIDEEVAV